MSKFRELLRLAKDRYARAKVTVNPASKRALAQQAEEYSKEAEELQGGRSVVQAAFPKPAPKIGQ
ncbi:MAG: hypothetical protein P8Y71_07830 [Pseudolabrys sp.]